MSKTTRTAVVGAVIVGLGAGYLWLNRPESDSRWQATDDAYIGADIVALAPEVAGRVTEVLVSENAPIQKDALIARIDDRDYRFTVAARSADLNAARATIAALDAQIQQQEASISQAEAQVNADQASLDLAKVDAVRYANLAKDGSGSVQARDAARTRVETLTAGLSKSQAGLEISRQQENILKANLAKAQAGQDGAQAALDKAELDLEHTVLRAPVGGVIGIQRLRVGMLASPQAAVTTIVPLGEIYVDANYRETQLDRVHPGQTVDFTVDAMPGETFTGKVLSLAPASGASFSDIPAHNATGNFTKIVQRLSVRIAIDPGQPRLGDLRVGMSARVKLDTQSGTN